MGDAIDYSSSNPTTTRSSHQEESDAQEDLQGDDLSDLSNDESDTDEDVPLAEDPIVGNSVTVKCITEEKEVFTQAYDKNATIGELKSMLVNVFGISTESMLLLYNSAGLNNVIMLKELGGDHYGILELTIKSKNPEDKIRLDPTYKDFTVPDVITVRVRTFDEGIKDVVVEIENRKIEKPFLGGYFDKESGLEYHHGYSQTGPPEPKIPPHMKNHRDTQTYWLRNRKVDTSYSHATQMTTNEIWIPNVNDRIILSKPYETAEELEKRLDIEGKVRTIQRYFKAWKMRKALKELSFEYHKRLRLQAEREALEKKEDADRKKRDLISKVFPRTADDFSMLYSMVERWKKAEIARIISMHCGAAKIAEFYMLLEKEIEILRSIEVLRQKLRQDRKIQKDLDFFKAIGEPVKWNSEYKNIPIQMDTLETQKGREYQDLYNMITRRDLEVPDRIQALLNLKKYLEMHNCITSNEILALVDRTCEMLARGFGFKDVEVLQKRIEALLLRHFELPECNEGVTNRKNRLNENAMKDNLIYCHSCNKFKPTEAFSINIRTEKAKVCSTCKFIDKTDEPWMDISPYRFILRQVRRQERLLHSPTSVAFILREKDIYYMVTHIWHSHSAMSECQDVYKLRLSRWHRDEPWSPWNCILLTDEEAKAHMKVERLEDVYDENFISNVFNKHALAKKHFAQCAEIERCVGKPNICLAESKDTLCICHDVEID